MSRRSWLVVAIVVVLVVVAAVTARRNGVGVLRGLAPAIHGRH